MRQWAIQNNRAASGSAGIPLGIWPFEAKKEIFQCWRARIVPASRAKETSQVFARSWAPRAKKLLTEFVDKYVVNPVTRRSRPSNKRLGFSLNIFSSEAEV
jgi:hypothetical protein